jgi:hypothetical protein
MLSHQGQSQGQGQGQLCREEAWDSEPQVMVRARCEWHRPVVVFRGQGVEFRVWQDGEAGPWVCSSDVLLEYQRPDATPNPKPQTLSLGCVQTSTPNLNLDL